MAPRQRAARLGAAAANAVGPRGQEPRVAPSHGPSAENSFFCALKRKVVRGYCQKGRPVTSPPLAATWPPPLPPGTKRVTGQRPPKAAGELRAPTGGAAVRATHHHSGLRAALLATHSMSAGPHANSGTVGVARG